MMFESKEPRQSGLGSLLRNTTTAFFDRPQWKSQYTRTLLQGSSGSLVVRPVGHVFRFAVSVILAGLLGAGGLGTYAYAITWFGLVTIPTTLGLEHSTLRFVAVYREKGEWGFLRGALQYGVSLGAASSVLMAVASIVVILGLSGLSIEEKTVFCITFVALPMAVLAQVRQAALRALDHPVLAQIPENTLYTASLVGFLLLMQMHDGTLTVVEAALANVVAWAVAFVAGGVFLLRCLPSRVQGQRAEYDIREWRQMVPSLLGFGVMYNVLSRGEVLVLGAVGSLADVGVYTLANRAAELILFMYEATTIAGASIFSALYSSGKHTELQEFTTLVTRLILWASFPVYVVVFALAPLLLKIFGPEFEPAVGPFRVLLSTYFVSSLGGFVIIMLFVTGHQQDALIAVSMAAVLNLLLALVLTPSYGPMGAAVASGSALIALKGFLVVVVYRKLGVLALPVRTRRCADKGLEQS